MSEKMPAATLEALKGSIRHWEEIVEDPTRDVGPYACHLCLLFFFDGNGCVDCPVRERTGLPTCKGSPYYAFIAKRSSDRAQAELDFLRSLLPAEE